MKPWLHTLERKYAEEKGPLADSVCWSTTWGKSLLLPLLDDRVYLCLLQALPKIDRPSHFEFQLRKVEFVFSTSWQPLRVAACYEGSGRYSSTSKSWIPFLPPATRESGSCYEGSITEVNFLDVMSQLRKIEFALTSQYMQHMPGKKWPLLWKLYCLTPATAKMDV